MTDLLTRSEYAAIAADLSFPCTPFIDGKYSRGGGPEMKTVNPAAGETLTTRSEERRVGEEGRSRGSPYH